MKFVLATINTEKNDEMKYDEIKCWDIFIIIEFSYILKLHYLVDT